MKSSDRDSGYDVDNRFAEIRVEVLGKEHTDVVRVCEQFPNLPDGITVYVEHIDAIDLKQETPGVEKLKLCYVKPPWAWFTTLPVEEQWGDDWDDAPYQHNAGRPYSKEGETQIKAAYEGPLYPPGESPRTQNNRDSVSVEDMNRGEDRVPWLVETNYGDLYEESGIEIYAGITLDEFVELVQSTGGSVYFKMQENNTQREDP